MPERCSFERVDLADVPWAELDSLPDRTVHQTREWLEFLAGTQRADPIVMRVRRGDEAVGWFTGAIARFAGIPMLGSPMRGWTTSHMGFNLDSLDLSDGVLRSLVQHAWTQLRCPHLELLDRRRADRPPPPGFRSTQLHSLELRLDLDDDDLLAAMTPHGRRDVRKALRLGTTAEVVDGDDPTFVAEYYDQVSAAFAKRGLAPTYPRSRVEALVRHMHPSGRLLLLRVRTPDGEVAATGIFPGMVGGTATFAMQASHPHLYSWYPNEVIVWEALRRWRDLGALRFDLGGRDLGSRSDFKRKFGGTPVTSEWLRWSRFAVLEPARTVAARGYRVLQRRRRDPHAVGRQR
jgi:hypothetical protein